MIVMKKEGFYGWIALSVAALVSFLSGGGTIYSFGAFLPSICREYGWSRALVSGALTMLMVIMSLSSPLAGFLVGRYGVRRIMVIGGLITVAGLLVLAVHTTLWQFYVGYGIFVGLGGGLGGMIPSTTVANNWFKKKISLAMGIIGASASLGGIIMIPLIMAMISRVGWRSTYLVLGGLMFVIGVIITGLFLRNRPEDLGQAPDGITLSEHNISGVYPEMTHHTPSTDFTLREALGTRALWLLAITFGMVFFILTIVTAHQVAFLEGVGISAGVAASVLGLFFGISVVGSIVGGAMGLKFHLKHVALISIVLVFLGLILNLFTRSTPMALAFAITCGLGYGGTFVAMMSLLSAWFGRTHFPKIIGTVMILSSVGNAGAPIAGAIYDATKSYVLAFAIALGAVAVMFICLSAAKPPVYKIR
jgi:MFS family permease